MAKLQMSVVFMSYCCVTLNKFMSDITADKRSSLVFKSFI